MNRAQKSGRTGPAYDRVFTADVHMVSARLAKLVELINEHGLSSVSAEDARYAKELAKLRAVHCESLNRRASFPLGDLSIAGVESRSPHDACNALRLRRRTRGSPSKGTFT